MQGDNFGCRYKKFFWPYDSKFGNIRDLKGLAPVLSEGAPKCGKSGAKRRVAGAEWPQRMLTEVQTNSRAEGRANLARRAEFDWR